MTDAELLRAILDASPDVVWFLDLEGRYVAVSPAAARLAGRPVSEIIGRSCADLFPPAVAARWEGQFRTVLASGATMTTEERLTVDGEERAFVSRQRVARRADGAVLGVCGIAQDVTAEQRRVASADVAQAAFDRIYDGMLTPAFTWRRLGDDFVLVQANQAARRMTDDRVGSFVGARASDFHDDEPRILEALARAWRERTAVLIEDLPYRMRTTGTERRVIASFVPLPPDTVIIHVQDITSLTSAMDALKRRVAEEAAIASLGRAALAGTDLPALFRRAAELTTAILGFDAAGILERQADGSFILRGGAGRYRALDGLVVVQANEGSHAGYTLARGEPVIVDDFRTETRFHVAQVVRDAEVRSGVAAPIMTPDGAWGVLGVHSLGVSGFSTGDVDFVVAIANVLGAAVAQRAATEARERSERLLRALSRRLFEVQEVQRREVARELHDEVGQLLTAVRLNLLGFRFPEGSPEARRAADTLDVLARGTDALRAIQLNLRPPLLDDLGLAPALAWYARRQLEHLAVQLTLDVDETMARVGTGTENACFRIAQEALTNALRHASPRHITITLRREGASLVLLVRDDGMGFDPASPRDPEQAGLAGMRERARGAGGTVEVESSPGAGTTVRAVFPVVT